MTVLQWNGEIVRTWLASRVAAARLDQDEADRQGRERKDDYDKAAAEEFVCRLARAHSSIGDQIAFAAFLKEMLARDDCTRTGVYSDRRFEREVKACLRKLIRMTKANTGFENLSHFQKD